MSAQLIESIKADAYKLEALQWELREIQAGIEKKISLLRQERNAAFGTTYDVHKDEFLETKQ